MIDREPIGVYRTTTGWAAYDRQGRTWDVTEAEASAIKGASK